MSRNLRLLLLAVLVVGFAPALMAQNAVVLGTVYDGTGAPMPGITILLENKSTGFARIATTGADGSYSIPEVPPADGYIITASKEGAELDVRRNISVNVGDERSILPPLREKPAPAAPTTPTGEPGAAPAAPTAAPVETGPAPTVRNETTQTSIGAVITGDQLRSLPLYNRNFLVLGLLTANTHDVEAGSPLSGASFSISGQRGSSNNFVLDGSDNVASSSNQAIPFQVNDAIQEFRVTSSTANAEYGRGSGGVVSVVTRRGTNQLRGAAFGYFAHDTFNSDSPISLYRGTGFDRAATFAGPTTAVRAVPVFGAQSAFVNSYNEYVATAQFNGYCTNSIQSAFAGAPNTCVAAGAAGGRNDRFNPAALLAGNDARKQPFFSKQFGANLGGAIIKDKLFAFGSYEATMIDNPTPIFERVPSAFDKTVKAGFNAQPANAANPNYQFAQRVLALFPAANVVGVPGVLEFFRGEAPNYTNVHNALLRMDWAQSDKNNFNFRYAGQLLRQLHDSTLPETTVYAGNGAFRNAQNQNYSLTWTRSFSPKLINEVRANVTQFRIQETPQDEGFNATTLGFAGALLPTINLSGLDTQYSGARPGVAGAFGGWYDAFWAAAPSVVMQPSLDGFFPFARLGAPLNAPGFRRDTNWAVADNLTWSRGKHAFKFGADFRYIQNRLDNGGFSRGLLASGNIGEFTSDSETCNSSIVNGVACNQAFRAPSFDYSLNQQPSFAGLFNSQNYSGYIQDSWRPRPGLTINMGVRYEYFGVPSEANGNVWNYDPEANGLVKQGGSDVFDPFGYRCGSAGLPILDAVVRDRSAGQTVTWTCKPSSQGRIIKQDFSNFGGRFGVAWDVFGNGKTVIRGGAGIFYDQLPINYMSQLMFSRPTTLNTANPRYIYGQNFLGNFVPQGSGFSCQQCGMGNASVNPASLQPLFQSASSPFGLFSRDFRSSSTPYTRQNNVTIQHQLTPNIVAEVGYIGTASRRLPVVYNRGYNNEWFCTVSRQALASPPGATVPACDNFSYFPNFTMANIAESSYHSVMARTRIVQFHGLRLNATYTFSKALDNASTASLPLIPTPFFTQAFGLQFFGLGNPFGFGLGKGGTILGKNAASIDLRGISISTGDVFTESSVTTTGARAVIVSRYAQPQHPTDFLRDERGLSDFHTTHRGVADFNYDIPLAKDHKYLGGWTLAGILAVQSGQPFTIYSGPIFGEVTQRANASNVSMTGDPNAYISGTFSLPAREIVGGQLCLYATGAALYEGTAGSPCTGNTGRNAFTGPAFVSLDMAIQKSFKVFGEGRELTLRTEAFNVFNRANYYNPVSVLSDNGLTLRSDFGQVKSAKEPRQLQFAIRFTF